MITPFGFGNFEILGNNSEYVTEDEAKKLIKNALTEAKDSGTFDDTKVYSTYDEMISSEPTGRTDVLYVLTTDDNVHGTRYVWTGSEYEMIQDTLTKGEISDIVK